MRVRGDSRCMPMAITISAPAALRGVSIPLRALIRAALAHENLRPGEIAVVLTDDAALRALNRQWRRIDRATDVLSFSYDEAGPGETMRRLAPDAARSKQVNGDLVISLDRMRDQAKRYRVSEGRELARLAIHGALHLAGLDHQRLAERRHMRARENAVLRLVATQVAELDRRL